MEKLDGFFTIGLWHLGCVASACLARLGYPVTCFDFDVKRVAELKEGKFPIHEPGLPELFQEGVSSGRIRFSTDPKKEIPSSSIVYITHDTPVDDQDRVDLGVINKSIDLVLPLLNEASILLISSQVPIGTSSEIARRLKGMNKTSAVCYFPENLRLGEAITCFLHPDRMVFGLSTCQVKNDIERLFSKIPARKLFMDLESAEMAKHALNSYLATNISFSSEIADLCEVTGANANDVMEALKLDKRVGEHAPIKPGLGFGGGTLARDLNILRDVGARACMKTELLDAVLSVNIRRMDYIFKKLETVLGSLDGRQIAFLGLTYKARTSTLRRSLALQAIRAIKSTSTLFRAYDPMIQDSIPSEPRIHVCKSIEEAVTGADALVITTAWDEFKNLEHV
ncbi:MAG: UDP-glucose/GDP-mannose dehydrogenase family protein, partial [Candidatus Lokiarchaeota archaeon]|nr:UDP-glucose/GDP-mannose dehydrogenase family protein [Candidatus Lokiarchaeota archaeon]